jgi:very-short-patch-repair endonuclease
MMGGERRLNITITRARREILVFSTLHADRIDLAAVDPKAPGRYLLGIECDGANYHRARTARDRDKLRDGILRDLGWRLHRIGSTDWWSNPEREIHKLSVTNRHVTPTTYSSRRWPTPYSSSYAGISMLPRWSWRENPAAFSSSNGPENG